MTLDGLLKIIRSSTQHKTLYHFTDEANFQSIAQNGLLSKQRLRELGLWPPVATGGNQLSWDLDLHRGIDPFVSLCFTRNHGMKFVAHQEGRLPNPRYLAIKPEVLLVAGTKIAFGIANANAVEILDVEEALGRLDVEILYTRTNWKDPAMGARLRAAEKFEILVPHDVPRNLITGVF